ncbi:mazG-like nucleoside triphosphate pyrophosphohydrolasE [Caudoviricetes sp.]|nr:mazG-like nucleoside triphosphate pyrophosphohydrolasE [Caudoviricetes sp.]
MPEIIRQVYAWNRLRQDKPSLAKRELVEADDVAIAAAFALRERLLSEEAAEANEALADYAKDPTTPHLAHLCKELFDVIFVAIGTLQHLGVTETQAARILAAGCYSNDSKPATVLKPGEKGSKGNSFVPAEPLIIDILEN